MTDLEGADGAAAAFDAIAAQLRDAPLAEPFAPSWLLRFQAPGQNRRRRSDATDEGPQ